MPLYRPAQSSIPMALYIAASGRRAAPVKWRIVLSHKGELYLHELSLLSTDTGSQVLIKLAALYESSQPPLARLTPFMTPVIHRVVLSRVPFEDIAEYNLPRAVDIDAQHYSHVLTRALHDPNALPKSQSFVYSYRDLGVVVEAPDNICQREALMIRLELNRLALLVFISASLALSVVAGVLAGVLRKSLDTGFGIGGGALGVIGVVAAYLTWRLK